MQKLRLNLMVCKTQETRPWLQIKKKALQKLENDFTSLSKSQNDVMEGLIVVRWHR